MSSNHAQEEIRLARRKSWLYLPACLLPGPHTELATYNRDLIACEQGPASQLSV